MPALKAAATAVLLSPTSLALACGKERWPVKVAADQDVGLVASTAAPATIATLTGFAAPPNPNIRKNTRFAPAERTPVTISGSLVIIKRETDQDYHLVVADPQNTGLHNPHLRMIVES